MASPTVKVAIGQIHKRLHPPYCGFNTKVDVVNTILRERCCTSDRVNYAFVRGLCRPSPRDYCDSLHLSDSGNAKFYRGVRGAVVRAEIL